MKSLLFFPFILLSFFSSATSAIIFQDDFNRIDGNISNGWSTINSGSGTDLSIFNNQLTNASDPGNNASIYRAIGFNNDINVTASIAGTHASTGSSSDRFTHNFSILSDGTDVNRGYSLSFTRTSQNYNNSTVRLIDNGVVVGTLSSSFQYTDSLDLDFTYFLDGSVVGTVSDDSSNSFNFNFGPRAITSNGSNFQISMGHRDSRSPENPAIFPTVDNLVISSAVPEPNSFTLAGLGLLGLVFARNRRIA
jgi:hypothetical protein